MLLIGGAGSAKEAEPLSVKGSFPSKPARKSDCLCQARIDRGRVGPPRAERPGASEAPDPSGGGLAGRPARGARLGAGRTWVRANLGLTETFPALCLTRIDIDRVGPAGEAPPAPQEPPRPSGGGGFRNPGQSKPGSRISKHEFVSFLVSQRRSPSAVKPGLAWAGSARRARLRHRFGGSSRQAGSPSWSTRSGASRGDSANAGLCRFWFTAEIASLPNCR